MLITRALNRADGAALWRTCYVCGDVVPLAPDLQVCDRCAEVIPADTAPFLYHPTQGAAGHGRGRS